MSTIAEIHAIAKDKSQVWVNGAVNLFLQGIKNAAINVFELKDEQIGFFRLKDNASYPSRKSIILNAMEVDTSIINNSVNVYLCLEAEKDYFYAVLLQINFDEEPKMTVSIWNNIKCVTFVYSEDPSNSSNLDIYEHIVNRMSDDIEQRVKQNNIMVDMFFRTFSFKAKA